MARESLIIAGDSSEAGLYEKSQGVTSDDVLARNAQIQDYQKAVEKRLIESYRKSFDKESAGYDRIVESQELQQLSERLQREAPGSRIAAGMIDRSKRRMQAESDVTQMEERLSKKEEALANYRVARVNAENDKDLTEEQRTLKLSLIDTAIQATTSQVERLNEAVLNAQMALEQLSPPNSFE